MENQVCVSLLSSVLFPHLGTLKSVTMGVFTPWKLTKAANQGFPPESIIKHFTSTLLFHSVLTFFLIIVSKMYYMSPFLQTVSWPHYNNSYTCICFLVSLSSCFHQKKASSFWKPLLTSRLLTPIAHSPWLREPSWLGMHIEVKQVRFWGVL